MPTILCTDALVLTQVDGVLYEVVLSKEQALTCLAVAASQMPNGRLKLGKRIETIKLESR